MKLPSPSSAEAVVAVGGLSRHFGSKTALDEVSLFITRGCVLGLVGENGAGKTTLGRVQKLIRRCPGKEGVIPVRQVRVPEQVEFPHLLVGDRNFGWVKLGV